MRTAWHSFLSAFVWAIFWKQALMIWIFYTLFHFINDFSENGFLTQSPFRMALFFIPSLVIGLYFLHQLFSAQLEKIYLRKNFKMMCVNYDGQFVEPRSSYARNLLWSFLWGYCVPFLVILSWLSMLASVDYLFNADNDFHLILLALIEDMASFITNNIFGQILLALILIFYPHYHLWTRPFHYLSGFRLATISI